MSELRSCVCDDAGKYTKTTCSRVLNAKGMSTQACASNAVTGRDLVVLLVQHATHSKRLHRSTSECKLPLFVLMRGVAEALIWGLVQVVFGMRFLCMSLNFATRFGNGTTSKIIRVLDV